MYEVRHKTITNGDESYINSPKWPKNKKAAINPKNDDDNCFQYTIPTALNHEQIGRDPQRM